MFVSYRRELTVTTVIIICAVFGVQLVDFVNFSLSVLILQNISANQEITNKFMWKLHF